VFDVKEGRILMAEHYKGRVYVNGLYVRTEKTLEHGYDILPKYLKLDRDRKMLSTFDLHWFTSHMWSQVKDTQALIQAAKAGSGDAKYTGSQYTTNFDKEVTTTAYEEFKKEHGENAVPVANQDELKEVQEKYEDAKAVLVPETLKTMVKDAPDYEVKAKVKQPMSKKEKLLVWFGKIQPKLSAEEEEEFYKILDINNDTLPF
jgi:hypothetical protein